MSGRLSPADLTERGLPEDVYINPDNLPPVSTSHADADDDDDVHDVAPARGKKDKKSKLKGMFKKPGKKNKASPGSKTGASQLGDVFGRTGGSSVSSRDDGSRDSGSRHDRSGEDILPTRHPSTDGEKSKMASFKDFFKKSDDVPPPSYSTSAYAGERKADDTGQSATMVSMRNTVRNFFNGPSAMIAPTSTAEAEVAELKDPPRRSACRMSIVMFTIFGSMVIIGIVLLIVGFQGNSRSSEQCLVLGPMFLAFGCFLIIGEIFFMMFWIDDPMPCLGKCMASINSAIGGVTDPYGLKLPETYKKQRTSYYPGLKLSEYMPPASPTAKETIPMKTLYSGGYSSGPSGPAAFDDPSGPAALDYNHPLGYKRGTSQESNISYQNSSYQDDSFTQAGRII